MGLIFKDNCRDPPSKLFKNNMPKQKQFVNE